MYRPNCETHYIIKALNQRIRIYPYREETYFTVIAAGAQNNIVVT